MAFGINQPSGEPVEEAAARPIGKERRIAFSWELRARPQGIAEEELRAVELDKIAQLAPFEVLERERVSVELGAHGPELRIEIDYR
ncbi:MAG: hypothetical protein RML12_08725 [Xanthomonadales bacterium]|nr:hypothetical protein [Xanthomonadales bacterium]